MIFVPFRYLFTGIVIGIVFSSLSGDYVIISRRRYNKLRNKEVKNYE